MSAERTRQLAACTTTFHCELRTSIGACSSFSCSLLTATHLGGEASNTENSAVISSHRTKQIVLIKYGN